jgi:hypothetical protein
MLLSLASGFTAALPFQLSERQAWTEKGTFSGQRLSSVSGPQPLSLYGGWKNLNLGATGFFHTAQVHGAWLLVDPQGYAFISMGLNSVQSGGGIKLPETIRQFGINTLGSWSDEQIQNIPYTPRWNILKKFIASSGELTQLYQDKQLVPVFYPEFTAFADNIAKGAKRYAQDPYVLGHFSDNEITFHKPVQLSGSLALKETDPLYIAAKNWLTHKYNGAFTPDTINQDDELEYQGYVARTYYQIVSQALKRYDPNHLYLGSRLHAKAKSNPYIIDAASAYADVISINYYGRWEPDQAHLELWDAADKPFLITEFYTKAKDPGMPNKDGAGWLVASQSDRRLFFENFVIKLMASKNCVGWHWFKYINNHGSNKGVFDERYQPYRELQNAMAGVAQQVYPLRSYLLDGTVDFSGLAHQNNSLQITDGTH